MEGENSTRGRRQERRIPDYCCLCQRQSSDLHLRFWKNEADNINKDELQDFKIVSKMLVGMSNADIEKLIENKELIDLEKANE